MFYRLHLIEAYGTGMPKIRECYRDHRQKPVIETTENAFKITLPNINYVEEAKSTLPELSASERKAFSYIRDNGTVTRAQIEKNTGITQSVVIRALKRLLELGLIRKLGSGKLTKYELPVSEK